MQKTMYKLKLKKVFIGSLLLALVLAGVPIAAPAYADPAGNTLTIASTDVSPDARTVTVTTSVYAEQSAAWEDVKTAVTVARTGSSDYAALAANDTVTLTNTASSATLTITFDRPLSGETNAIRIAAGALVDDSGAAYDESVLQPIAGLNVPAWVGASYNGGDYLTLNFGEYFDVNVGAGAADTRQVLRSGMSVSHNGGEFEPLKSGNIYYNSYSRTITIEYDDDMPVLSGTNTRIKIAAGVLKDANGIPYDEVVLDDVTPPAMTTAAVSGDYRQVTIAFSEPAYDKTLDNGQSELHENIYLLRDGPGSEQRAIGPNDTVSIVDGKLVLQVDEPLAGANNVVVIGDGALQDAAGNYADYDMATPYLEGGAGAGPVDRTPPRVITSFMSNAGRDAVIVFDEAIVNNLASLDDLKATVTYSRSYVTNGYAPLPADSELILSGNLLTVRFATPMFADNDMSFAIAISSGSLKDQAGNVMTYMNDQSFYQDSDLSIDVQHGSFANNGSWLLLDFNEPVADDTIQDGISHLKAKIAISTDQGTAYTTLSDQDDITLTTLYDSSVLMIRLHEPVKAGSVRVRIEAGAFRHTYIDFMKNETIDRIVAMNTPTLEGYFFAGTDSVLKFDDNAEWRESVTEVMLYDEGAEAVRMLRKDLDYTLQAGQLTVNSGIFRKGIEYALLVHADGYSMKMIEGIAIVPSEAFYMTAPVWTTQNGLTAKIDVVNMYNYYYYYFDDYLKAAVGNQTIVFRLMDGNTAISVVTADFRVATGTYTVNFNVPDAATNPKYKVDAFIVTDFHEDGSSVGTNLATVVTPKELETIRMEMELNRFED